MPDEKHTDTNVSRQSPYYYRLPLSSYLTPAIIERFFRLVKKTDTCWIWTGSTRKGYGKFHPRRGVTVSAPRFAYLIAYGVDPGALDICHRCDSRICLNPSHLFLGTAKDNSDDKIRKGRGRSAEHEGERNPRAKLTAADIEEIKARITAGDTNTAIARDYPISHHTVSRIRLGKVWSGPRSRADINAKRPTGLPSGYRRGIREPLTQSVSLDAIHGANHGSYGNTEETQTR